MILSNNIDSLSGEGYTSTNPTLSLDESNSQFGSSKQGVWTNQTPTPIPPPPAEAEKPFSLTDWAGKGFFDRIDSLGGQSLQQSHTTGVPGDQLPYTVRGDSVISILLIACFVVFVLSVSRSMNFLTRQLKNFVFPTHNESAENGAGPVMHFLVFLVFVDCLTLAIGSYIIATSKLDAHFMLNGDILVIVAFFGLFVLYFLAKGLLYRLVNAVFFDGKRNLQMTHTFILLAAAEGVLLFPMVLLQVYFDLTEEKAIYYFGFVLILNKLLSFYKGWHIFFRQNGGVLQTFLYFCALEMVPLLAFVGIWLMTIDLLKINF
ncbi:MAG: DUF4271 domain-containing protein [Prevotella sp.]|nr:DUF4271 domain-containing protein [Prevotella sp.]